MRLLRNIAISLAVAAVLGLAGGYLAAFLERDGPLLAGFDALIEVAPITAAIVFVGCLGFLLSRSRPS